MDIKTVSTPEKLHQAIGEFLQSDYSHENLVKMYDDARKCVIGFRGIYSTLPALPAYKDNPLDGLQDVMDWCIKASEVVDDIVSNLERQTISEIIRQLKKLRDFPSRVLSLVNSKLREQAQKEARAKVENEYKNLNEKASRLKIEEMPLILQAKIASELELDSLMIPTQEVKEAVQIYLSKDPTFKDRISRQNKEINEVAEKINKLIGSETPTGKLLDIYCKLKDIPLQQQYDKVGCSYPYNDLADVIFGNCSRLYTSIDTVIKTFEEIQTKAEQKKAGDKKASGKKTRKVTGQQRRKTPPKDATEKPKDLISLLVCVEDYFVSRTTLKRQIKAGNIKSYRLPNAAKNSPHLVSKAEVANIYSKRQP